MSELSIPFQRRDQTVADAISCNVDRVIPGEDGRVAVQLLFDAAVDGHETMGDLVGHVAALDAKGRQQLLDRTRSNAGLPSLEPDRARRRWLALNPTPPALDAEPEPVRVDPATMRLLPTQAEAEHQRREERKA